MASRLFFRLAKLRINKPLNRFKVQKYFLNKLPSIPVPKQILLASGNRIVFKIDKSISLRSRALLNYRSNLKYITNRVLTLKIKFPNTLNDFKYLNKGCSGVICTIPNESNVIVKQAYKFNPYDYGMVELKNENTILDKLQRHPNIIEKVNDKEMESVICQDTKFKDSCPDVEHYGLTQTLILERMNMNLEEMLKVKNLSVLDRIDILSQILEAQVYMNRKSICHRDMKLSNILVKLAPDNLNFKHAHKFIVKVADFDCAIDLDNVNHSNISHQGANICTAPEILNCAGNFPRDLKNLYSKNDIWAIGGMAYELFGYENPFIKIDARRYSLNDLPQMTSVPLIIQNLVKSLLNPLSNLRYQACVTTDILQIFRMKLLVSEEVFALLNKKMSSHLMVAFCYLNQLFFTGHRFLANPKRMEFVLNYIENNGTS